MNTTRYQVIDRQTGDVMGCFATRTRARRRADLLDQQHGAIRYAVVEVSL